MNKLNIIHRDGKLLADSRKVAKLINTRHSDLLGKIDTYIKHLTNGKFRSLDYFLPSTYEDEKGQERRCFLITKRGCEMIANKLTGEKGVHFTAAYVEKFEEMENYLQNNKPTLTESQAMAAVLRNTADMMDKLPKMEQKFDQKIETIDQKIEAQITLTQYEQMKLRRKVASRVTDFSNDKDERKYLFPELYREIYDRWGVPSYRDVLRKDLKIVMKFIEGWVPKRRDEEKGEIA
ncbi:Rha family transcriptional regulator [Chengkuizengella axinellae]|uniref:Rha family transcriptional regulator n=1 Tax=Chengkuizengella axinellae TaxID=3064388 RepID=A0ABT9IXF4_9BACL|nr:Rha family transcriptional regulator [Chengkuizengella sp. 2205SS18-9]MDP5273993.1 Rha family transcriptional regulator [Chengkuizengella sp. 2205SS18-9]